MSRRQLPIVLALGTTQTLAWASSYYLPAILADPIARDLGVSSSWIFAAFSAALVISALLGPRVGRGVGIDNSSAMLAIARAKLAEAGLRNCHVRQADMYDLPWRGESFDAIAIHHVLHFAEQPAAVVAQAAGLLRPQGRFLIVDFAPHGLETLRLEHAHRRLGFANSEVTGWLAEAGLKSGRVRHLRGKALTVSIWSAVRSGSEGRRRAMSARTGREAIQ